MGEDDRFNQSLATIHPPTLFQRGRPSDKINTVAVDRPSPKEKRDAVRQISPL